MPKDLEELRLRLQGRATDPEDEIERRLQTAISELGEWKHYDFCVHSRSKDEDYEVVKGIWCSEKRRVARMRIPGR
jgi:guanylate kinase